MTIDIVTATRLVGPGMARTALAQIRKKHTSSSLPSRSKDTEKTDEAVYQESLRLMRQFLKFVCITTVEDLSAWTSRHMPAPPSVRILDDDVPASFYDRAAELVQRQLGPLLDVVGRTWWQWRKPGSEVVKAQWMEMMVDYQERMRNGDNGKKVIFYVHGGAYYLGGVGHDVQIQRHARKLKGRCYAPRYRLAPQFPFPCAVHDIVSAYLYLLTMVQPEHVVLAGDSAGGGLCLALLQIIRDQGLPMPAGASLISPWVDLTHSFPSIIIPSPFDYVPSQGFHAKPSLAWPPPTPEERRALRMKENTLLPPDYVVEVDGEPYTIAEQVNMYAPNLQLVYPLVSPVHAATLGGFCPCQVIIGGGELLRDEQLYLAHKMANPVKFPPSEEMVALNGENLKDIDKFPPTDVELLFFDDGPHAAPTLGHIDIAKYQYRAISQFAAWALARAQGAEIEIEDYRGNSPSSPRTEPGRNASQPPSLDRQDATTQPAGFAERSNVFDERTAGISHETDQDSSDSLALATPIPMTSEEGQYVGLHAGDTLPPFEEHMIRFRVDRQGRLYSMEPPHSIRALQVPVDDVGRAKGETFKGWIRFREEMDKKFATEKRKVFEKRLEHAQKGYIPVPNDEIPPPSALVGRRVVGDPEMDKSGRVGSGIFKRLYRKMEKGGMASDDRTDAMENCEEHRASRIVQPDQIRRQSSEHAAGT